jgi:TIR domain
MPIVQGGVSIRSIAMPLVASGDQRWPPEAMFAPLIEAAVRWLESGLPIDTIKIVQRGRDKAESLRRALVDLKVTLVHPEVTRTVGFAYDVFLSYARKDAPAATFLGERLREHESRPRVFQDTLSINPGTAWQQEIWEALEACRRVVVLYSPDYLASKVCQEEYGIARLRDREVGGVLVPLYLVTAPLPAYMRVVNYVDCRESDLERVKAALPRILTSS